MLNSYKKNELSEEQQEEMSDAVEEKADATRNFFLLLISGKGFQSSNAVKAIPFICFLAVLGMIYIANRHFAEQHVREIESLSRDVKTLSWEYKSLKADLMLKSTLSEVSKKVDTLGLKTLVEPPKKIIITTLDK